MVQMEFTGGEKVARILKMYEDRVGHVGPLLDGVGAMMAADVKRRFATETDPEGNKWARLAAGDVRAKARDRKAAAKAKAKGKEVRSRILRDTGLLQQQASAVTFMSNKKGVIVGEPSMQDAAYGQYHQFGAPKRNLPRRSFLGWNDDLEKKVAHACYMWIADGKVP